MAAELVTPPKSSHESEPTSPQSEALSDPGIEKRIPLRFINLKTCTPGPGCPDNRDYDDILRAVDISNDVFKAAGVQFWVKSIERFQSPNLADMSTQACDGNGDVRLEWQTVRDELRAIFPQTSPSTWADGHKKTGGWWLLAVNTLYSPSDELVVWLLEDFKTGAPQCDQSNSANGPYVGRDIKTTGVQANHKLAHELGHAFGLNHPWEAPWTTGLLDPSTGVLSVASDYWDLVYYPGPSGNEYFASKAEADDHEADLVPIMGYKGSNCTIATGVVTCQIEKYGGTVEAKSTGDPAMKGLGFTFANWDYGPNIMSYLDHSLTPNALSDSQIMRIREHLRWSVPLNSDSAAAVLEGAVISTKLPHLGSWSLREVARQMDFDDDGKRDIGIWDPPTSMGTNGTFTVLLSGNDFSTSPGQYMSVQHGQLGDIPVVADYDADGQADLAVFQPGGGLSRDDPNDDQGYWRWCLTAQNAESTTCPVPPVKAFGKREDVPLPGLSFAGSTPLVSIFRPNNGMWQWRAVSGVWATTKYLGGRGSVLRRRLPHGYRGI